MDDAEKARRAALGKKIENDIRRTDAYGIYRVTDRPGCFPNFISEGIKRLVEADGDFARLSLDLASCFYSGDYGHMYDWDEHPTKNYEAGLYTTDWGEIYFKREVNRTTMCMYFER